MSNINNAALYDPTALIAAGINPKTGLPEKMTSLSDYSSALQRTIEVIDEQDFVNKGTWDGLPEGLDGELLERIMFYRGQGILFKLMDKFYFLPYALDGTIDVYGRYLSVTPVPMGAGKTDANKPWIQGLKFDVLYKNCKPEPGKEYCIILQDRSPEIAQTIQARSALNKPIYEAMAEAFPFARTNLLSNSGVKGMRVQNESDQAQVKLASRSITKAALSGDPWVPIIGNIEFQELTEGGKFATSEYTEYFQALDNYRLKTHGLDTTGVFEKKGTILQDEQEMNSVGSNRILDDTTRKRQEFCELANEYFGLNISYTVKQPTENSDIDSKEEPYEESNNELQGDENV